MTIEMFEQRVSRALKRGRVFDEDIPGYAKDAVRTLEDMHDWKHMWVEEEIVLTAGSNSRTIDNLKNCRFIKRKLDDGTYIPVIKVSPIQLLQTPTSDTRPNGFWMETETKIRFDAAPSENITLRYGYYQYSTYDDNLPWLSVSESLLIAQTILEMAPLLKDPNLGQMWGPIVAAKLQALGIASIQKDYDGQSQSMVPYADDMDDYIDSGIDHVN